MEKETNLENKITMHYVYKKCDQWSITNKACDSEIWFLAYWNCQSSRKCTKLVCILYFNEINAVEKKTTQIDDEALESEEAA